MPQGVGLGDPEGGSTDDDGEFALPVELLGELGVVQDRLAGAGDGGRGLAEQHRPVREFALGVEGAVRLGDVLDIVEPDADDLARPKRGAQHHLGERAYQGPLARCVGEQFADGGQGRFAGRDQAQQVGRQPDTGNGGEGGQVGDPVPGEQGAGAGGVVAGGAVGQQPHGGALLVTGWWWAGARRAPGRAPRGTGRASASPGSR